MLPLIAPRVLVCPGFAVARVLLVSQCNLFSFNPGKTGSFEDQISCTHQPDRAGSRGRGRKRGEGEASSLFLGMLPQLNQASMFKMIDPHQSITPKLMTLE